MAFMVKVSAPEIGLVADYSEGREPWYLDGWSAQRVAEMLMDRVSQWRFSQVVDGGGDALDEQQVEALEAGAEFFALIAQIDRGEAVELEAVMASVERVSRAADGVVAEEAWKAS